MRITNAERLLSVCLCVLLTVGLMFFSTELLRALGFFGLVYPWIKLVTILAVLFSTILGWRFGDSIMDFLFRTTPPR